MSSGPDANNIMHDHGVNGVLQAFDGTRTEFSEEVPGEGAPKLLKLYTLAELKKLKTKPDLVHGLVPRDGLSLLVGESGKGKSFLAIDLAMHVAMGWDYRGRRVRQGPVVLASLEAHAGVRRRLLAWCKHHSVVEDQPPLQTIVDPLLLSPDGAGLLIASVKTALGDQLPALLVIDTLARAYVGSENDDRDMGAFIRAADRVRHELRCTLLVVHHQGKNQSRGPRGHSSLNAAADSVLAVEKNAQFITMTVEKLKDGRISAPITSTLQEVELEGSSVDLDPPCVAIASDYAPTKRKKVTGQALTMLRCIENAIYVSDLKTFWRGQEGGQIPVVRLELVRDMFRREMKGDWDKQESGDTAARRAIKKLKKDGFIDTYDGMVRLRGQTDKRGQSADMSAGLHPS